MSRNLVKKDGERRRIEEPTFSQKKKQRKIIERLKSNEEINLEEFNFFMKGPKEAVEKFEKHKSNGYQWIAKLDVKNCFPSINPNEALSLIDCEVEDIPEITNRSGLPQGHPLSNFLAEFYLDRFDKRIRHWPRYGCKVIRYVDDIWLMCKKKKEVEVHFKSAVKYLNDLGLRIHSSSDSGASIKHVNEGVEVLGFIIDRRTKRPLSKKVKEHKMKVISLLLRSYGSDSESTRDTIQYTESIHDRIHQWGEYFGNRYAETMTKWINKLYNTITVLSTRQRQPHTTRDDDESFYLSLDEWEPVDTSSGFPLGCMKNQSDNAEANHE